MSVVSASATFDPSPDSQHDTLRCPALLVCGSRGVAAEGQPNRSPTQPSHCSSWLPSRMSLSGRGGVFFPPPGCTMEIPSPTLPHLSDAGPCDTHTALIATSVPIIRANKAPGASREWLGQVHLLGLLSWAAVF